MVLKSRTVHALLSKGRNEVDEEDFHGGRGHPDILRV